MDRKKELSQEEINDSLEKIASSGQLHKSVEYLKTAFSLIDLTSLSTDDTEVKIRQMCNNVNSFSDNFPGIPNVGAVCVYPALVGTVKDSLLAPGVGIASVAAGFPSSQTFTSVKEFEARMCVEFGATEIDIVISVGKFLDNDLDFVDKEIRKIKETVRPARLKVILETGLLPTPGDVYAASALCLKAGADFIKTSTGKVQPASTPEDVYVMCHAIKDYYDETGKMAGIKPAGGIGTAEQALEYASIVRSVLGDKWLDPDYFRIGASRLANQILTEISLIESGKTEAVNYF